MILPFQQRPGQGRIVKAAFGDMTPIKVLVVHRLDTLPSSVADIDIPDIQRQVECSFFLFTHTTTIIGNNNAENKGEAKTAGQLRLDTFVKTK